MLAHKTTVLSFEARANREPAPSRALSLPQNAITARRLSPFCPSLCAAFALLAVACAQGMETATFVVSTQGNDNWSGALAEPRADRSDGPLATVQRAIDLVAELRNREPERERRVVVAIRGGVYFLEQPIILGPEASGSENAPTVFEAYRDERPVLSGGRQITAWQVGSNGRWQVELADVKAGKWDFAQLFVDDGRRYRPRLPQRGCYRIARQLETDGRSGRQRLQSVRV